jgi:hypothetical protein
MLIDVYYIHPKTKEEKVYHDTHDYGDKGHPIYWYIEGDGNINCNRVSIFGLENDFTDAEIEKLDDDDDYIQVELVKILDRVTGEVIWPELMDKFPNLDKAGFRFW